jgi:hypothetical protein
MKKKRMKKEENTLYKIQPFVCIKIKTDMSLKITASNESSSINTVGRSRAQDCIAGITRSSQFTPEMVARTNIAISRVRSIFFYLKPEGDVKIFFDVTL